MREQCLSFSGASTEQATCLSVHPLALSVLLQHLHLRLVVMFRIVHALKHTARICDNPSNPQRDGEVATGSVHRLAGDGGASLRPHHHCPDVGDQTCAQRRDQQEGEQEREDASGGQTRDECDADQAHRTTHALEDPQEGTHIALAGSGLLRILPRTRDWQFGSFDGGSRCRTRRSHAFFLSRGNLAIGTRISWATVVALLLVLVLVGLVRAIFVDTAAAIPVAGASLQFARLAAALLGRPRRQLFVRVLVHGAVAAGGLMATFAGAKRHRAVLCLLQVLVFANDEVHATDNHRETDDVVPEVLPSFDIDRCSLLQGHQEDRDGNHAYAMAQAPSGTHGEGTPRSGGGTQRHERAEVVGADDVHEAVGQTEHRVVHERSGGRCNIVNAHRRMLLLRLDCQERHHRHGVHVPDAMHSEEYELYVNANK
mmetsp:Transcript_12740/g.33055  ORF Transcript_12740/g.33055 Transcript_12740/m.33055 type:complete len:427 (+) Transcript_12740:44-1324(+)